MNSKPNILFIFTDQQHHHMMSCAGNPYVSTPAMDSIASEAVRFDRAYCANPVCSPSRFSLMTGHMPSAIDMYSNLTKDLKPIPESTIKNGLGHLLRKAGYTAAYAGKTHLPQISVEDLGFDYICEDEREELATACVDFLEKPRDKPFCLFASFINPHDICYMAPCDELQEGSGKKKWHITGKGVSKDALVAALARPEGVDEETFFAKYCPPLPPNYEPQKDEPEAIQIMLEIRPFRARARRNYSEERWREHRWAYARLTELVDRQIGRVLEALHKSGQADNTLLIFTSDHGDMDASFRMEHKSALYDEACRIPLLIRPPGKAKAARLDQDHLISNGLDLLPTFCDYAGVAPPPGLPGRSLRPLVENQPQNDWRTVVPVECAIGKAIITDRFKYARYEIGERNEQLMDLKNDPHEKINVVNDPAYQKDLENLRVQFDALYPAPPRSDADVLKELTEA